MCKDQETIEALASPKMLDAIMILHCRIAGTPQRTTAEWWAVRADNRNLETMCLIGVHIMYASQAAHFCGQSSEFPSDLQTQWATVIERMVHVIKMIEAAKLTSCWQNCLPMALRTLAYVSSMPSWQKTLSKSQELIGPLLYAVENNCPEFGGLSTAAYASMAAVNLIGRNEGGLTLTRMAVDQTLLAFKSYFDPSSRRAVYAVQHILPTATPIVHLIVPDKNKEFVLEHQGALDSLVSGLLLDGANPRRTQEGASELQRMCALVLQNLALSPIGVKALRAHSDAMAAIRELASKSSGAALGEKAQHSASGALFELEEETRQVVQATVPEAATEHIMLSYNWDHQDVIKRVHASLVRHGYSIWIDVEQMQGSTVEAMAKAVEGAAVVCYGISEAYKASANCRLEAQYAFQRKKDMIPLMMQEGYIPDGWLGMFLGVRLWYGFYGPVLANEAAFEGKIEELCREVGKRGKRNMVDTVGLASTVNNARGRLMSSGEPKP
eukprot:COSAG01_NODE_3985_length_5465_cov_3.480432_6_plen_497_part_00